MHPMGPFQLGLPYDLMISTAPHWGKGGAEAPSAPHCSSLGPPEFSPAGSPLRSSTKAVFMAVGGAGGGGGLAATWGFNSAIPQILFAPSNAAALLCRARFYHFQPPRTPHPLKGGQNPALTPNQTLGGRRLPSSCIAPPPTPSGAAPQQCPCIGKGSPIPKATKEGSRHPQIPPSPFPGGGGGTVIPPPKHSSVPHHRPPLIFYPHCESCMLPPSRAAAPPPNLIDHLNLSAAPLLSP